MACRFPAVRVAPEGPLLIVDNRLVPAIAYATYNQQPAYLQAFADAGYNLFSVVCTLGDRGVNSDSGIGPFRSAIWTGPAAYRFEQLDADANAVLAACPMAYLLFRVYLDVPSWWDAFHPAELNQLADGTAVRQSLASQVWLQEAGTALKRLLAHINRQPYAERTVGIMVAAGMTEEWFHHGWTRDRLPDYSSAMQARAAAGGDTNLATLLTPAERRGDPSLLLRTLPQEQKVVSYYQLHSQVVAEAIKHFCRVVKEASAGRLLAGAFYGYIFEVPSIDAGHHAAMSVLTCPDCDFLASPNSYMFGRRTGHDWAYFSATDSVRLHGKLWLSECDTRTDLTRPLKESRPDIAPEGQYQDGVWLGPRERSEVLSNLRANLARAITTRSGLWWFDMWGGWYDAPDLMQFMTTARRAFERCALRPLHSTAQVAVFVDERSCLVASRSPALPQQLLYFQRVELAMMGAPYDVYYLEDLAAGNIPPETISRYRLLLFLNAFTVDATTRSAIRALQCAGRVLCWFVAPGFYGGGPDPSQAMTELTGIRLAYRPPAPQPVPLVNTITTAPAGAEHWLTAGVAGHQYGLTAAVYRDAVVAVDPDAVSLGFLSSAYPNGHLGNGLSGSDSGVDCGLAVCEYPTWTSVFSAVPRWPWQMLRNACRRAGVHLYTPGGETMYANNGVVALRVMQAGAREVNLPQQAPLYDLLTGALVSAAGRSHRLYLEPGLHLWSIWNTAGAG
jgi:hypothetical protein